MKRLPVILTTALLTACVSLPTPTPQSAGYQSKTAAERQSQLTNVTSWTASGALSIQQTGKSPIIMRYEWQQQGPDYYHIELAASLNLAAVTITGRPNRVTLQRGNEAPISATTPQQLMQRNLGWSLPVPNLWYWARGLPAPGARQNEQYDTYGHLIGLQQNGWHLRLGDYRTVEKSDLPQLIELQQEKVAAKIVIKQWQIGKS